MLERKPSLFGDCACPDPSDADVNPKGRGDVDDPDPYAINPIAQNEVGGLQVTVIFPAS